MAWTLLLLAAAQGLEMTTVYFSALGDGRSEAAFEARQALANTGVLAMRGVPGLEAARAFLDDPHGLLTCLQNDQAAASAELEHGTRRWTAAAASPRGSASPRMSSECGAPAADLRLVVDMAGRKLFQALDASTDEEEAPLMRPSYASFAEIAHAGEHLEHLHVYQAPDEPAEALRTHVDAGLLISMVAGQADATLSIELPSGATTAVSYDPDTVLFLAGEGGATWLARPTMRPVPHALTLTGTRAWFGKMWLPPSDGVVESSGLPYSEHRERTVTHAADNSYSIGCSPLSNRRLGSATPEFCTTQGGDDGLLCWAQCVSIEDLPCDQTQAACIDYETGQILDGSKHCDSHSFDECGVQCLAVDDDSPNATVFKYRDESGFCVGDGVTMFMDGFRSIFEDNSPLCVNLYMTKWTLDTRLKFGFGVVAAFFVGIAVEALVRLRRFLHNARKPTAILLFLHFCQSVLGYLAMFVAMTYQVELFVAVCLGTTFGNLVFNAKAPPQTNDPCCAAAQQSETLLENNTTPSPLPETKKRPPCCAAAAPELAEIPDCECKDEPAV